MADLEITHQPAPVNRRRHAIRLALFTIALVGLFVVVAATDLVDVEGIRRTVESAGPLAPVAYVLLSAVLATVFVPGPILAAGSGVLFGPVLGTVVTLCSAIGTAVLACLLGRRGGRDSARVLLGADRADRLDSHVERYGLWAVVGQRFVPGISDAMAAYAFGALGMRVWQMALGALIGSAPRAFVYTALGASIDDLTSPLAYVAIAIWCVTAIAAAVFVRHGVRAWRSTRSTDRTV